MGERVLPTADELAAVHSADSLKDLQRLALLLDDQPVFDLLGLAQVRRMRIDLDRGLREPELVREKEARWQEYLEQRGELERKRIPSALTQRAEALGWMPRPSEALGVGQSGDQRG